MRESIIAVIFVSTCTNLLTELCLGPGAWGTRKVPLFQSQRNLVCFLLELDKGILADTHGTKL